jgi:release factor glutamine methyltransferase
MLIYTILNQTIDKNITRLDAELLLAKVLNKPRSYLYAYSEQKLSLSEELEYQNFLNRRLKGEPIAYIIGEKEFWSLSLKVNNQVLIPRPETELLIELALLLCKFPQRILDLGTGSGAIALALASELTNCQIIAVDNSINALQMAKNNAENLRLNINFIASNWLQAFQTDFKADIIISNPPYIEIDDEHLNGDGVSYEPLNALVATKNGLSALEEIIISSKNHLNNSAWLLLEHGYKQAESVRKIFAKNNYKNIVTKRDLAGQERVTYAQMYL